MKFRFGKLNNLIAVALVFAACVGSASFVQGQTQSPIPASFFGMSMQSGILGGQPWPTASFGGVRLWDTNTSWAEMNTSSGVYTWTNLDNWIAAAQAHNEDMIYTFGNVPQWASSNPNDSSCSYGLGECDAPNDLNADGTGTDQQWKNYVTAVVTHAAGRIQYWELWNEPNNPGDWTGTVAQLARMAKDAYPIIKAIDPSAQVLTPSASSYTTPGYGINVAQWLSSYFAAGAGSFTDIVAFHGYYYTTAEDITQIVGNIRTALTASGQSGKPLWDTEASWGTSVASQGWPANLSDPNAQAAFLARYYLLHWSEGVSRFYWYSWNNTVWGTLWNPTTNTTLPAGTAYIQVYKWLVGSKLTTPCSANSSGIWTCMFTNASGQPTEAVWNPSATSTYTAGSQYTSYTDLTGAVYTLPANGSVSIGAEPILLMDTGAKAAITPVAVLTVSPQSGTAPVTVTANGSGSYETGGSIASSSINFGDGTVVSANTATHTYNTAGTYTVQLTVKDASGTTASASSSVIVTAAPATTSSSAGVTITSPTSSTSAANSVNFVASAVASSGNTIVNMQILVDSIAYYNTGASSLNTSIWIPTGQHAIAVTAEDNTGKVYSSTLNLTVGATTAQPTPTPTPTPTSSTSGITVTSPASGATVANSVNFVASATASSGSTIVGMQVLVDSITYYNTGMNSLNAYVWIPNGQHVITIKAEDNTGKVYSSTLNLAVQ